MTIPVWVLLGFAGWTLLTLTLSVGLYRWSRILTGRSEIKDFRGDAIEGTDFYKRAMRAHANCVENLPVYGALVVAARAAGLDDPTLDALACTILAARVVHTTVHVAWVQTNAIASLRFGFFFIQLASMVGMAMHVVIAAQAAGGAG